MKIKACLTNNSDLWNTPKKIYKLFMEQNYYDPCPENPKFDGLKINWKDKNFVNPPYSQIDKWIDKAIQEKQNNRTTILLIPSRTDTKWFRKLVDNKVKIYFIQGRLKFNEKGTAPFPSMFVEINKNTIKTEYHLMTKELIKKLTE